MRFDVDRVTAAWLGLDKDRQVRAAFQNRDGADVGVLRVLVSRCGFLASTKSRQMLHKFMMYSADISSSSIVLAKPRLSKSAGDCDPVPGAVQNSAC
jgi:O-glycosyl hydrolase